MIYGLGMMYKILDQYAENSIDEKEHAYIYELKWPDSYILKVHDNCFWDEIQRAYGIYISEDKADIITISDLKRVIESYLQ